MWDTTQRVELPPRLNDPAVAAELSPTAVTTVEAITEKWGLTLKQKSDLMGGINPSTYKRRLSEPGKARLSTDELTRASLTIGIYRALHTLYSGTLPDQWMKIGNRNPLYRGVSPLEHVHEHGIIGLTETRTLLDGYRGGR